MENTSNINILMASFGYIISAIVVLIIIFLAFYSTTFQKFIKSPFTFIASFFLNFFKNNGEMIGTDNCAVIQGTGLPVSRVPSTYLAHVVFFFSFLFTNAYTVFNLSREPNSSDAMYENRRNRSAMIMAVLVLLYIILIVARSKMAGCESYFGVTFTTIVFGALGVGTYKLAEICGARPSDVLGITTMFVSDNAKKPVVCVPRTG